MDGTAPSLSLRRFLPVGFANYALINHGYVRNERSNVKVEIVICHLQLFVIEDVKLANWNRALRHKSSFPIRPNCQLHLANAGTLVITNH